MRKRTSIQRLTLLFAAAILVSALTATGAEYRHTATKARKPAGATPATSSGRVPPRASRPSQRSDVEPATAPPMRRTAVRPQGPSGVVPAGAVGPRGRYPSEGYINPASIRWQDVPSEQGYDEVMPQPTPETVAPGEPMPGAHGPEYMGYEPTLEEMDGGSFDPYLSNCCGPMCGGCGRCNDHFSFGFDFVFVQPYFQSNPGLISTQTDSVAFNQTNQQFDYDHTLSPRVWLGYAYSSGLGVRARYWQFDQQATPVGAESTQDTTIAAPFAPEGQFAPATTQAGQIFSATSGLSVHALDVEGTKLASFGYWNMIAAAGLRYGKVNQTYQGEIQNEDDGEEEGPDSTVYYNHGFEGFGPTFAVDVRRNVGYNFSFFSSARMSLLFGNSTANLNIYENLTGGTTATTSTSNAFDSLLPIAELQVGGEWRRPILWGRGQFFLRGALEGQLWQGIGNATSQFGDAGFFGLSLATGMRF